MTFSARFLMSMIDFAAELGADRALLIERSGLSVKELEAADRRVGPAVYSRVIEDAVESTGDGNFGLHAGESMQLSAAGLIGQITQNAPTIREAFQYSCEFAMLGCRALPMELEEISGGHYKLAMEPDPRWTAQSGRAVKETVDGILVFTLRQFSLLAGGDQQSKPFRVEFGYPAPSDQSEYARILKCPVKFGVKSTALFFDKAVMEREIKTADFELLRVLVAYATDKSASLRETVKPFSRTVEKAVINLADPTYPSLQEVARHLNQSVRSLQRRLSDEGSTFKALTDGLRQEFARSYLSRAELSIGEIAYLLGYAESSAFIRSFKRWEGISPRKYRTGLGL